MKRKSLAYDTWTCILSRELHICRVTEPFAGHVSLLRIQEVTEPQVWQWRGQPLTVCDKGMAWLTMLPEQGGLCITAQLNADGSVALWYIDMIDGQGVDTRGVPWFDDLYLDLIIHPNGTMAVDDRDELDAALAAGDITVQQHRAAVACCARLQKGLESGVSALQTFTNLCYQQAVNAPAIPVL